jgi:hypothetical protein
VNETRQGKFVNGQVKSFAAKGRKKAADVIISDALSAKFDIEEKEYLPADGDGIIWITNVGLKPKGSDTSVTDYYEVQISYDGMIDQVASVYIYVNNAAQALSAGEFKVNASGKKVHLRLNLIDPPVGLGGG